MLSKKDYKTSVIMLTYIQQYAILKPETRNINKNKEDVQMKELRPGDRGYIDPRRYIIFPFADDMFTRGEIESIENEDLRKRAKEIHDLSRECHFEVNELMQLILGAGIVLFCGLLWATYFIFGSMGDKEIIQFLSPLGATKNNASWYMLTFLFLWVAGSWLLAKLLDRKFFAKDRARARERLSKLIANPELVRILVIHSPKLLLDAGGRIPS